MTHTHLPAQLDSFLEAHLAHIALVPIALYLVTPMADLVVCLAHDYATYAEKQVYHTVVAVGAYPLSVYFAAIAGLGALWLIIRRRIRIDRQRIAVLVPFVVLLALAAVSTATNPQNPYRFTGVAPSFCGVGSYFVFVLVYLWCASVATSERVRRGICLVICATSVPIAMHALWLCVAHAGEPGVSARPDGIFYNINHYGYFLAMAIPLCACLIVCERRWVIRAGCAVALTLNVVVLLRNNTLGAWLACLVALVVLAAWCLVHQRERSRIALLVVAWFGALLLVVSVWDASMLQSVGKLASDVGVVLTGGAGITAEQAGAGKGTAGAASGSSTDAESISSTTTDSNSPVNTGATTNTTSTLSADEAARAKAVGRAGSGRWKLWTMTAGFIKERPWLGWGAEGIADELYAATKNTRAHSEPIMYAVYFGIPAALCYLWGCTSVFFCARRRRATLDPTTLPCLIAALGYFVSSVFGNMYFYTTPLFFMLLGLAIRPLRMADDAKRANHRTRRPPQHLRAVSGRKVA